MLKKAVVTAILLTAIASQLNAATVTYTMHQDRAVPNGPAMPGSFVVTAKVTPGDNGGLSGYGMDLLGGITAMDHKSPRDASASTATAEGPAGFTFARSADNLPFIAGFQDTSNPDVIPIYGLGQEASSAAAKGITFNGVFEGATWDAELILATGTYSGVRPTIRRNSPNLTANVFVNNTSTQVRQPDLICLLPFLPGELIDHRCYPEPSSAVLLGFNVLAITAFRRRAA